ncbi:acetyl-CoA carboxylase carboxyltransferase subunit alpha [Desulfosporosinus meridiei]|uniref:Acetyl-coenzyme A carboxylase carboxyl transferase subunit alpha n=1 Tax=Desulfosporosinus meridiei (strain ATCC BAA-275 / DSM 13257 / KCTC 12902 / NCIMB 13706 / S10) TaxID=768704 RepID=J7J1C4_DESMD|nr:acetyl-CoA carboxylase carboxyltransferase subunit alpha [Desulfosporosinus meridiei]AFQ44761.1 acetyl-CoA carboxylase carboxyltransferase subunit alpha [Desulfosporosinus meridiei DSM 13257]
MAQLFEFEKPIAELEHRISELQKFSADKGIDLSQEVDTLEKRVLLLKKEIYGNLEPWQKVQIARHSERPNFYDYAPLLFEDFIELKGDRLFADDHSIAGGIALFHGVPVTVVAQVKGKDTKENIKRNFGMPHPEGYRKAIRLMDQAEKFGRPILTFIDTPGAACDLGAEERGQGEAIARCLLAMSGYRVPVISTVIGEGGSGGALALGVCNVLLMLENSFYSVIAPESCASILWKDTTKAKEAAAALKFTAKDLLRLGVADELVREPQGGAHNNLQQTADELSQVISKYLVRLRSESPEAIRETRYQKLRKIGMFRESAEINLTKKLD